MMQNFTSAATSINKNRLPAVYGKVAFAANDVILDYGCGRYTDHIRAALPEGAEYLPYDIFNQPQTVNYASVQRIHKLRAERRPVTVVCSNVLNVIDGDAEIRNVLQNIAVIIRSTRGTAYITVYEGNRSGIGRQTGPDQWQRNQKLADYLAFIPCYVHAEVMRGMIILKAETEA